MLDPENIIDRESPQRLFLLGQDTPLPDTIDKAPSESAKE